MERSMYFSLAALLSGVFGIIAAVWFKDSRLFIVGIVLAVLISAFAPQKKKKQQES